MDTASDIIEIIETITPYTKPNLTQVISVTHIDSSLEMHPRNIRRCQERHTNRRDDK